MRRDASVRFSIPADRTGPAVARRRLDEASVALDGATMDRARLAVSEVVTNAIIHGAGRRPVDLVIEFSVELLRVEVIGGHVDFESPLPQSPGRNRTSGWGLEIVEHLVDRWGVESGPRVWFEIDLAGS